MDLVKPEPYIIFCGALLCKPSFHFKIVLAQDEGSKGNTETVLLGETAGGKPLGEHTQASRGRGL